MATPCLRLSEAARGRGALVAALLLLPACLAATARPPLSDERLRPAPVIGLRWRTVLHQPGLGQVRPEECASGALVRDRLVLGSRGGSIVGVDTGTGRVDWSVPATGGIDSQARFDEVRNQVYVGTDDGALYAVDPDKGSVRWSYKSKGAIEQAAEVGKDAVFAATAGDRVFALDAASGRWRWQYERDAPEGFTIHGYAGPRLAGGKVLAGFSDGYLVALDQGSGEVQWARSLAAASDQFVDVDATPAATDQTIYAASYSGGLYALDPKDGGVRWRLGIEGAGMIRVHGDNLYFAAPREGLHALDRRGAVLWRQGLSDAGDLSAPTVMGPYLVFTGSRAGLFVVERASGSLLQIFNPGRGICGAPTPDTRAGRVYVLSNGGSLYALDLAGASG